MLNNKIFKLLALGSALYVSSCGSNNGGAAKSDFAAADSLTGNTADGYAKASVNDAIGAEIGAYLRNYFQKDLKIMDTADRKFSFHAVDLNADQKPEYIVFLQGRYFCGSGGCTFLVMNSNVQLINYTTVMDPPVYVSAKAAHGWRNLLIKANNTAGAETYRVLSFDPKTRRYPSNASMVPEVKEAPAAGDLELWGGTKVKIYRF